MGFYFSPRANILHQSSGGGGVPLPVTSGLQFHFDATLTTSLFVDAGITNPTSQGDSIQEWHSQVGGYVLEQTTLSQRPQLNLMGSSFLNGQQCLIFDGSLDFMEMAYDANLNTQDGSYFIVTSPTSGFGSGDAYFQLAGNGNGRGNHYYQFSGDNEYSHGDWINYYVDIAYINNDTTAIMTADTPSQASGLYLRTNGSSNTDNSPNSVTYYNQPTWLGRDYFGGDLFAGYLAEWGKFDRALTSGEVTSLMNHFSTKYGTPT